MSAHAVEGFLVGFIAFRFASKRTTNFIGGAMHLPTKNDIDRRLIIGSLLFGAGWGSFRIAHLSTGDRIGVELFQFTNQQNPENNFEYWKTGIFHFCVQDPNVEELAERIAIPALLRTLL